MTSEQSHFEPTAVLENSDIGKRKISPFHLNYHFKKNIYSRKLYMQVKIPELMGLWDTELLVFMG